MKELKMVRELIPHLTDDFSGDEIREIAELHFIQGIPTEELMERASTARRRTHVAAVALYRIEENRLMGLLAGELPEVKASVLRCHQKINALLKNLGVGIRRAS